MSQSGDDRLSILLVDNDRLILATLARGIRRAGYEAMETSSGDEARGPIADQRRIAEAAARLPTAAEALNLGSHGLEDRAR
ncbi:MAG: hypothetical protein M0015_04530 [Betaproteobacteria bacterium]|nr:hypothetical protein [Betaproteobacteria bacterium]